MITLLRAECERVYEYLFEISLTRPLDDLEMQLAGRLASKLDFEPIAQQSVNNEVREIELLKIENFRLKEELARVGMPNRVELK
jgi:hypothetical protein